MSEDRPHRWETGVKVYLTAEEIAADAAKDAAWSAGAPMREWLEQIAATDRDMPRYLEDILAASDDLRGRVPQIMRERFVAKQALRSAKPQG